MTINALNISYPDFVLGQIINPDEFDQNNVDIINKVNQIITGINTHVDGTTLDHPDGSVTNAKLAVNSVTNENIVNKTITTEKLSDNVYTDIITVHHNDGSHDERYYTKDELIPYLQGGDTTIREEVFTIVSADNGDGTFTYNNGYADFIGTLTAEGGQLFTLQTGSYLVGACRIEAIINDTLRRSVSSGGLAEYSDNSFILTSPEGVDAEITVKYFERIGLTGEASVIVSEITPAVSNGDILWYKIVG